MDNQDNAESKVIETEEKIVDAANQVTEAKILEATEAEIADAGKLGENAATIAEIPEENAADAEKTEETATADAETNAEEAAEKSEPTEEELKAAAEAKSNKIKIGFIVAGLCFILLGAVYAAAVAGGRTNNIPVAMPDTVTEELPEPTKEEKVAVVIPSPEVEEEEEPQAESLLAIMLGNRRYDECIYADGGVVIVRKGDLYGAMDYEGNEIAAVKYAEIIQRPTKGGRFVLGNSKVESITEEKDGATLSYEKTLTTYTLFDNEGNKIFEGYNRIATSDEVYMMAVEDDKDIRNNRIEYYRYDGKSKAFMVIYVKDAFSMIGFNDGKTIVYGFTAVPTEDQDTNPTNLVCGIMNEHGKVSWFATAPGISEFTKEVEQWKEENKTIKTTTAKKKKAQMVTSYDENGNEILISEDELENGSSDSVNEDNSDENVDDIDLTEEELETIEEEADISNGPEFHMDGVLNAPVEGYFVVKDIYDINDAYSFYDTKGNWIADLDTAYMQEDAKKGFVNGNFNNGSVTVAKYLKNGQLMYNYGTLMVLNVGKKDVLIDVSKAKGMKSDSLSNKIVLAVYDDIVISDSEYWVFHDGDRSGYIDHKGNEQKLSFSDATPFYEGKALVADSGNAYIIDAELNILEEISGASNVDIAGDLMMVFKDGVTKNYILKENRDNPLGVKEEVADEDPKAATPAATENSKTSTKKKK